MRSLRAPPPTPPPHHHCVLPICYDVATNFVEGVWMNGCCVNRRVQFVANLLSKLEAVKEVLATVRVRPWRRRTQGGKRKTRVAAVVAVVVGVAAAVVEEMDIRKIITTPHQPKRQQIDWMKNTKEQKLLSHLLFPLLLPLDRPVARAAHVGGVECQFLNNLTVAWNLLFGWHHCNACTLFMYSKATLLAGRLLRLMVK